MEKISLEITEKDYRKLVELVYLGVVLHKTYSEKEFKSMHKAEQAVYYQATKFDSKDLVKYSPELKKYIATTELMDRMDLFREEYDYNTFYDELIERLAEREFLSFYSREQSNNMDADKKEEALDFLRKKYDAAAMEGGLLRILEKAKNLI
jgi:hypothetical protein